MKHWTEFTLKEQIGQMVVVRASGYLFDHQIRYPVWEPVNEILQHWLQTLNLGGVILLGGSAAELALRTQQLQNWATTPLLVAADIEEGVGQRFSGASWFPPLMALGKIGQNNLTAAKSYSYKMGAITAVEALSIGINWILAPIVDININPDNPVINVRSFGDNPQLVTELATAFIGGANNYPVLTTAKHFPGHGDTATDSHLDLPLIPHSPQRLQTIELKPFEGAIAAGVDSVMSGHLLITAWDSQNPATLSKTILTEQLRQNLGFKGLIVTDALIMGGITQYGTSEEIAVKAVEAGTDILLMPKDPVVAIEAIYQAVESGRISQERIAESAQRIWRAKQKLPLENLATTSFLPKLSQPEASNTVKGILQDSMEIGGTLPIQSLQGQAARNLIVVDDLLNSDFLDRQSPGVVIPKQQGYELQLVDQNTLLFANQDKRVTLLQIFIRGTPFRGSAGLSEKASEFYANLLQTGLIQGLIIYGSPYVLEWFRPQLPRELPWVFSYGQMPMAQQLACGVLLGLSDRLHQGSDNFSDKFIDV
ncbi:glycoside hydrolase family 3 domain protein [Gloeothece citriformis PCC 7424]|uniref:beta-N-acetylhexosaminidase n=1 Tax=Gloeothece citriformis (strain PCC 7424) TaxID=65393 RepID=B7KDJ8_GLOC7|nr:glycoside hydrolase family 3 N-terminal domain-containing protein [Gloeothece citriformis]ACK70300.1 glycoside hydrolase family 3 domain protein [Gloeothece citriformis PCC 7424]